MQKNLILQILAEKVMRGRTSPKWDPIGNPEDLKILIRKVIEEKPETFHRYLSAVETWRRETELRAEALAAEIQECPPTERCEILAKILSNN